MPETHVAHAPPLTVLDGVEYLTVSKIANLAGVSRATIYAHIGRGNLKTKKVGTYTLIEVDVAETFLNRLRTIRLGNRDIVVFQ